MCGISIVVAQDPMQLRPPLQRMVASQRHRGPDGEGTYVAGVEGAYGLGMGHNRLAILDLTDHGGQPMVSADGRYVLAFNGEIYNFIELAAELDLPTEESRPLGDTEVVLHALARWGPEAFARFNGMWAIALYDRSNHSLLVSRDRLGIKPLYTMKEGDSLYFASEVKAILLGARARLPLNAMAAVPYLTRGLMDTGAATFFEGISSVEAGTWSVIDLATRRNLRTIRYWTHPFHAGTPTAAADPEAVRELLVDAVRIQLRSDVPMGVLLSGGIDSSSILGSAEMCRPREPITCLSMVSDDPASDESGFIRMMAESVRRDPVLVNVSEDPARVLQLIPEATWFNDQPLCGVSDIGHLLLMQVARARGIKVLLSGQGSDEQFGGYSKFFFFHVMGLLRRRRFVQAAVTTCQASVRTDVLSGFRMSEAIRYLRPAKLRDSTYINPRFRGLDDVAIGFGRSYEERECRDLLELSLPQLLHFEDRMSMSQSVEIRVPFLDHRLVELSASISSDEKFAGGWSKSVLRTAIRGVVPDGIRYRRDKKGFNVPEHQWMKGDFVEPYKRMLAGPMLAEEFGLIDRRKASDLHDSFLHGRGFLNARHLFRLYLLEPPQERLEQVQAERVAVRAAPGGMMEQGRGPDLYNRAVTESDRIPRRNVAVIDLATGNIGSVLRMLERMGARPRVWKNHGEVDRDSAVILPGVGHFSHASRSLDAGGWRNALQDLHQEDRPILGICLGAQLLCDQSEEGTGLGLGWIRTPVRRFPASDAGGKPVRVPNMGWLDFTPPEACFPFRVESGRMYYAHSFYIQPTADPDSTPYQAEYGGVRFAAAVRSRNAIGVQFHPEKSHRHGLGLLGRWLRWTEGLR